MSLQQKLMLAFVIVLVLVGAQAVVTDLLLTQVVEGSALLVRPALSRVDQLAHTESDLLRMRTLEYSHLWSASETVRQQSGAEMAGLRAGIQARIDQYAELDLDQARADAIASVAQGYGNYLASQQRVAEALQRGDQLEAQWEYVRFQDPFRKLDDELHSLRHREYAVSEAIRDEMVQVALWARWPLGLVVVLVAGAELAVGWYVSRRIALSLEVLQTGARRIAREDFDEPVAIPGERELADLAGGLNEVMVTLAANKVERARLEEERLRLLQEHLSHVVRAQEEERARVSRELHDQAGQALTALHYGLGRVQRLTQESVVAVELQRLVALAAETGRQIAALARDLRPAVLDDLGLIPALRSYTREFSERIALPIDFSISGSIPRLSPEAETTVFRVVQEALTNVAKHAGAHHAYVELAIQEDRLQVAVRDDGCGFNPRSVTRQGQSQKGSRPGLGLAGIKERVQLLGGTLMIDTEEGKGTQLIVTFPVNADLVAPAARLKEATR